MFFYKQQYIIYLPEREGEVEQMALYDSNGYNAAYAGSGYISFSRYMSQVFGWMFTGLLVTFAVAVATAATGLYIPLATTGLVFVLSIAELVLVFVLAARIGTLQPGTATAMFYVYAALTGVNLSVYFIVYDLSTLILAFLLGAVYFGVMAMYGARTEKDLTGWGPKLLGGLVAMLIVEVVGSLLRLFLHVDFGMADLLLCGVALVIFMGFTAYDTQKLQRYYSYFGSDVAMLHKSAVIGALDLYLDYINIFLYLVRILGRNSRRD